MNAARDPLVLGSRTDSERDRFRFRTADGVSDDDAFCPGELLVLEHLWDRGVGRLRTVDSRYGVVGVVLAEVASTVEITTSSARSAALCERNVAANDVEASVSLTTGLKTVDGRGPESVSSTGDANPAQSRADAGGCAEPDTVAFVPKAYDPLDLGIRRIQAGLDALAPDGELFVAARPETGLARYESTLGEAADRLSTVSSDGDWTLLRATPPTHVDVPADPPFDWVRATVGGVDLSLVTASGLFAPTELDAGTRLLAETATVSDGDRVLDLCCGYGPLGAYAGRDADCEVWCSDDDALATACAERTLDANGVDGLVVTADCVDGVADRTFDAVLCNPPTHAGDGVLSALFDGVGDVLAPDGRFWFVHHRALDLSSHVRRFDRVESVATGAEHVVRVATV